MLLIELLFVEEALLADSELSCEVYETLGDDLAHVPKSLGELEDISAAVVLLPLELVDNLLLVVVMTGASPVRLTLLTFNTRFGFASWSGFLGDRTAVSVVGGAFLANRGVSGGGWSQLSESVEGIVFFLLLIGDPSPVLAASSAALSDFVVVFLITLTTLTVFFAFSGI